MTSFRPRLTHPISLAGTLALVLGLAGCGVKGPLEPPPYATVQPTSEAEARPTGVGVPSAKPSEASLSAQPGSVAAIARGTTSNSVMGAAAAKERSALDWLIE